MDEADQTQKYSSSGGSGGSGGGPSGSGCGGLDIGGVSRSLRMPKQKKVPQRGLGVAQLEKIRLEEQQKKDPDAVTAALILSTPPSVPKKPSLLTLPLPSHHTSNPSSSFPFPSPSLGDLLSLNLMIRPPQPVQNVGLRKSSSNPIMNQVNGGGSEAGCSGISVPGHGSLPKLWNSKEYNLQKENPVVDPGSAFLSNLNLPYESDDSVWPPPGLMPRTQQHQQPSHAMVNVTSGTSSSSVLNSRMEPPSNQSFYGNYAHIWPEEEKVVGMKRPYPFSPENLPRPSLNHNIYASVAPIRSDETVSCGDEGMLKFEVCNAFSREGPSCSSSDTKLNLNSGIKENEVLHGDFLTLAPPSNSSTRPSSTSKHRSVCLDPYNHIPDFESLPYQGSAEGPVIQPGRSQFNGQPFYSFFPPAEAPTGEATTTTMDDRNASGETGDLNLKL